jgi:hypothetical protein
MNKLGKAKRGTCCGPREGARPRFSERRDRQGDSLRHLRHGPERRVRERGRDHDTPAFAVASIRRWRSTMGAVAYPDADELFITADAGGSNGYRSRAWKADPEHYMTR